MKNSKFEWQQKMCQFSYFWAQIRKLVITASDTPEKGQNLAVRGSSDKTNFFSRILRSILHPEPIAWQEIRPKNEFWSKSLFKNREPMAKTQGVTTGTAHKLKLDESARVAPLAWRATRCAT
jgi:hypothetical protein